MSFTGCPVCRMGAGHADEKSEEVDSELHWKSAPDGQYVLRTLTRRDDTDDVHLDPRDTTAREMEQNRDRSC